MCRIVRSVTKGWKKSWEEGLLSVLCQCPGQTCPGLHSRTCSQRRGEGHLELFDSCFLFCLMISLYPFYTVPFPQVLIGVYFCLHPKDCKALFLVSDVWRCFVPYALCCYALIFLLRLRKHRHKGYFFRMHHSLV